MKKILILLSSIGLTSFGTLAAVNVVSCSGSSLTLNAGISESKPFEIFASNEANHLLIPIKDGVIQESKGIGDLCAKQFGSHISFSEISDFEGAFKEIDKIIEDLNSESTIGYYVNFRAKKNDTILTLVFLEINALNGKTKEKFYFKSKIPVDINWSGSQ